MNCCSDRRISGFLPSGTVSFDGKLHLESQLAVNEKMRGQLFRAIRENFQPIDEPGYSAVSFQVSGTVDRPKTNLMDKLIGRDLKDLGSVITTLMGGGKSEKAKKKKAAEAAEPSPAWTPTPTREELKLEYRNPLRRAEAWRRQETNPNIKTTEIWKTRRGGL